MRINVHRLLYFTQGKLRVDGLTAHFDAIIGTVMVALIPIEDVWNVTNDALCAGVVLS